MKSIILEDGALADRFAQATTVVEVVNESGRVLGKFVPLADPPELRPVSPDELVKTGAPAVHDSRDCVNLVIDTPGDTTVRPLRPELRQLALAERERIARWQEWLRRQADEGK